MIDSFREEYRFLSNFYPANFVWQGFFWPTVEHAYQAAKTLALEERIQILGLSTPGQAKSMGRRITMRDDWDHIKVNIMREIVTEKFNQNSHLMYLLEETKPHNLIEGNTWGDIFWGQCNGQGENHLGRILMEIRDGNAS